MKLTNNLGLPDTFVNAISRPTYTKGDAQISATEILNSPRIVQLKRQHWDDLEEDAADMVWSLFGSAVHEVLQHGKDDHHVVEERIHTEYLGWKISGAIDLQEVYDDGIVISDYKVTSAWAVMNEKVDWHNQLNTYAWLVERVKKQTVKSVRIVAIVRDWSRRDAATREGYPKAPVTVIELPLWSYADRDIYITNRLTLHNDAFFAMHTGHGMPECSADEMWERQTSYALKKEGNVRAKSVYSNKDEADLALVNAEQSAKKNEKFFIEVRPGERIRCQSFCQVAPYCTQYQAFISGKDNVQFPHQGEQDEKPSNTSVPL